MRSDRLGRWIAPGRDWSRLALFAVCAFAVAGGASAQQKQNDDRKAAAKDAIVLKALRRVPRQIDASPLPNYTGDFVSLDAAGAWHKPANASPFVGAGTVASGVSEPPADCSREAIIRSASEAPYAFEADKKGLLYGVQTHTPETRVNTKYWNMPGFNSCALVVYAILKKAGCAWARYTADAKGIYDMAFEAGWRPSSVQEGGCMVAWNSKWEGKRPRIGDRQKQAARGSTSFRHVGITTGAWLSVDNTSWLSRPTTYLTIRPITYEPPIFLCPPGEEAKPPATGNRK